MSLNHLTQYSELTDEHFMVIGKIVVEWANVESLLKSLLSKLLLTPDFISRTYSDCINAATIQNAIIEAVELHKKRYQCRLVDENTLDQIVLANKQITQLRANRNKFAHFCWSRINDEEIFGTNFSGGLPGSKKHQKGVTTIKKQELEQLYLKTYSTVEDLMKLIDKLPKIQEEDFLSIVLKSVL